MILRVVVSESAGRGFIAFVSGARKMPTMFKLQLEGDPSIPGAMPPEIVGGLIDFVLTADFGAHETASEEDLQAGRDYWNLLAGMLVGPAPVVPLVPPVTP